MLSLCCRPAHHSCCRAPELQTIAKRKQNPESCPAAQDADELFDAFKCIETLLIQRRSQMAAWSSLSVVASTTTDEPTADKVCGVTLWLVVWVRSGIRVGLQGVVMLIAALAHVPR